MNSNVHWIQTWKKHNRRVANTSLNAESRGNERCHYFSVSQGTQKNPLLLVRSHELNTLILPHLFMILCYREGYRRLKPPFESSQWFCREGVLDGFLKENKGTRAVGAGPRAVPGGGICSFHCDLKLALGTLSESGTIGHAGKFFL